MRLYTLRRAWTSLLVVGVPLACLALVWWAFMGGRANAAALALVYLLLVACGRAQAIKRERTERPYREARVAHQLARIRSTLPGVEDPQPEAPQAEVVALERPVAERPERPVEAPESLRLRAV